MLFEARYQRCLTTIESAAFADVALLHIKPAAEGHGHDSNSPDRPP